MPLRVLSLMQQRARHIISQTEPTKK